MSSFSKSKSSSSTTSYHSPMTSCGPLDNEFLQFYAELYKSAVLYSDYDFQQRVLYPGVEPQASQPQILLSPRDPKPHSASKVRGHGHGGKNSKEAIPTSSVRRKVSFSKHSPRLNLITPTPPSLSPGRAVPRITVQEQSSSCWSSELEESDTSETEQPTSDKDSDISDFKQARVTLGMQIQESGTVQLFGPGDTIQKMSDDKNFERSTSQDDEAPEVLDLETASVDPNFGIKVDNLHIDDEKNDQSFA